MRSKDSETNVNLGAEQAEYDARWGDEDKYSAGNAGYTPNFLAFMRQWVGRTNAAGPGGISALEVGCGDGFFSAELAKLGCRVTGIDLSPVEVAKAQERVPEGRFVVHDLSKKLPFGDGEFDLVWCSEVL